MVVVPRSELRALEAEGAQLRRELEQLRAENGELRAANAALEIRVTGLVTLGANLQAQLNELAARLGTNSRNSSKPPSSDRTGVPPRGRGKTKDRARGGQTGHTAKQRSLVPADQVTSSETLKPPKCRACGAKLDGDDPEPLIHQVIDIPRQTLTVAQYKLHRLRCSCGVTTCATLPTGVSPSHFGPRLHALVATGVGQFRLSKRTVVALLELIYGLKLGVGTVCRIEHRVSAALAVPVAEVKTFLRRARWAHADETVWRLMRNRAWLWMAATAEVAAFWIRRRRGSEVSKEMLGEAFDGVLCTDRYSAYNWVARRALCWAHLVRDFTAMIERHGGPWHGHMLRHLAGRILRDWASWHTGEIDRATLLEHVAPLRARFEEVLGWAAANAPGPQAQGIARDLAGRTDELWRFLDDESVAPTNNLAERLLRYAVILRKLTYGSDSLAGSLYMERLLTTAATLGPQKRNLFDYLTDAMTAHFAAQPVPSLLPVRSDP